MTDLPDWTNNELIVGFVITFCTTAVIAIQGTVDWYVPVLMGLIFGSITYYLFNRQKVALISSKLLYNLSSFGKIAAKALLIFFGLLISSTLLVFIIQGVNSVFDSIKLADGLSNFIAGHPREISYLMPIILYLIIIPVRTATSVAFGSSSGTTLYRKIEPVSIGLEFCTISLVLSVFSSLLYSIGSHVSIPELPPRETFIILILVNFIFVAVNSLLVGKYRNYLITIKKSSAPYWLIYIISVLGTVSILSTSQAIFTLFGS